MSCSRSRAIHTIIFPPSLQHLPGCEAEHRHMLFISYLSFLFICDLEFPRGKCASHSYDVVRIAKNKRCWKHIHKSYTTHHQDSYLSDDSYNSYSYSQAFTLSAIIFYKNDKTYLNSGSSFFSISVSVTEAVVDVIKTRGVYAEYWKKLNLDLRFCRQAHSHERLCCASQQLLPEQPLFGIFFRIVSWEKQDDWTFGRQGIYKHTHC